jgi:GT2 family glycosyltransferase
VTAPDLGRHPPAEAYDADILILTLDRLTETEAALRSALAQVGLTRRVILLDQGSAPETWQRLSALVAEREDALLVSAGGNLGVAEGRNRASALGLGRVIIALDNDAVFADATTAARAVAVLDLRPDLAAVGFRIMNGDGSGEDDASWGYPEGLRPQAAGRFNCATFVGAGHAIRRAAWDEVGGYDARLFFTWEEFDFSLRAIQAGWRLLYAGDIAVHHALAAEGRVGWSGRRWFLYTRNRLYISLKWRTGWPSFCLRVLGYWVRGALHGLGRQSVAAIIASFLLARGQRHEALSPAALAYLRAVDGDWRGGLWRRLRLEVLIGFPGKSRPSRRNRGVTKRR